MNDLLIASACAAGMIVFGNVARRLLPPAWRAWPVRRRMLVFVAVVVGIEAGSLIDLPWWSITGVYALVLFTTILVRRRRPIAVENAIRSLSDPALRAGALSELRALHGSPPTVSAHKYAQWSQTSLYIAQCIARANLPEEALAWASAIHAASVEPVSAAIRAQLIAACRIATGDRAGAKRELALVTRPVPNPLLERALTVLDTLLDAIDGNAERAESVARLGAAAEKEKALRASWQAAHAHALARLGRHEEALAVLREVRGATPEFPMLERIVRHGGPASPLAATLLADDARAYR